MPRLIINQFVYFILFSPRASFVVFPCLSASRPLSGEAAICSGLSLSAPMQLDWFPVPLASRPPVSLPTLFFFSCLVLLSRCPRPKWRTGALKNELVAQDLSSLSPSLGLAEKEHSCFFLRWTCPRCFRFCLALNRGEGESGRRDSFALASWNRRCSWPLWLCLVLLLQRKRHCYRSSPTLSLSLSFCPTDVNSCCFPVAEELTSASENGR